MYCPNPECPFFLETGTPAEYRPEVLQCADCGSTLQVSPPAPQGVLQSAKPSLRRASGPVRDPFDADDTDDMDGGGEDDHYRLLTVATYIRPESAHAARGILESVGLTAFVNDDHVAGMALPLGALAGGVKLEVPAAQAEQARDVLDEYRLAEDDSTGADDDDRGESEESDDAFFVNAVFAVIKWAGYAVVAAGVFLLIYLAVRG